MSGVIPTGGKAGVNMNKSKGSQNENTSYKNASATRAIAPAGWEDAWRNMRSQLSPSGLTAAQQQGADWMSSSLGGGDPAGLGGLRLQLGGAADYWKDAADHRSSNTLATLAARYPDLYKPLQDVAAGQASPQNIQSSGVTARDIAAQRGSQFLSDYQNPYMKDVVDTSLADYDSGAAEARNSFRAGNAGAFGNKRTGVAEGQFAADSALGRGKLAADLRAGGFNTAAALGMQDADRTLSADQSNQSASLQAALANSSNRFAADQFNAQQGLGAQQFNISNDLAARQFNNQMQNEREKFDVDAGYRGYEMRDNARRAYENNLGAQAGLAGQGFQMNSDLAQGLLGAGGVGQSQNLAWLNAAAPLFGQSNDSSGAGSTASNSKSTSKGGSMGM